jgi:hypothetical protein
MTTYLNSITSSIEAAAKSASASAINSATSKLSGIVGEAQGSVVSAVAPLKSFLNKTTSTAAEIQQSLASAISYIDQVPPLADLPDKLESFVDNFVVKGNAVILDTIYLQGLLVGDMINTAAGSVPPVIPSAALGNIYNDCGTVLNVASEVNAWATLQVPNLLTAIDDARASLAAADVKTAQIKSMLLESVANAAALSQGVATKVAAATTDIQSMISGAVTTAINAITINAVASQAAIVEEVLTEMNKAKEEVVNVQLILEQRITSLSDASTKGKACSAVLKGMENLKNLATTRLALATDLLSSKTADLSSAQFVYTAVSAKASQVLGEAIADLSISL